ncbi:unnamed protein product, partial [marine sediment metagenome]
GILRGILVNIAKKCPSNSDKKAPKAGYLIFASGSTSLEEKEGILYEPLICND